MKEIEAMNYYELLIAKEKIESELKKRHPISENDLDAIDKSGSLTSNLDFAVHVDQDGRIILPIFSL